MTRPLIATLLLPVSLIAACSGDDDDDAALRDEPSASTTSTTVSPYDTETGAVRGSHDCIPPAAQGVEIAWDRLRNPIYEESAMTKDMAVRWVDGRWNMFYSSRLNTDLDGSMGYVTSTDWTDWEPTTPRPDDGGSSDVTRLADGRYAMVHQVDDTATNPIPNSRKIVSRVGDDLEAMVQAPPTRLAPGIYDQERLIDGALAHTQWGTFALFKRGLRESLDQVTTLVHSPSGNLDGPWELVGDVTSVGLLENYQFLTIDGVWHLLGTAIPFHDPTLFRLTGDPSEPASWLDWTLVRSLELPVEDWNAGPHETRGVTHDVANSGFLCDARALDGYFYLFYAGATELTSNDGRGHQKIGVARSTDLESWEVPPGR